MFGIGLAWILTTGFLQYDPIFRYHQAFQNHREIKHFETSLENLARYALLNNSEFMVWSGFPMLILFFASTGRSIYTLLRNQVTRFNIFTIAFFLTYLVINLLGQTKGEVGRMWMFLLPVISVIAGKEVQMLLKDPVRGI